MDATLKLSRDGRFSVHTSDGIRGTEGLHCPAGTYEPRLKVQVGETHITIGERVGDALDDAKNGQYLRQHCEVLRITGERPSLSTRLKRWLAAKCLPASESA